MKTSRAARRAAVMLSVPAALCAAGTARSEQALDEVIVTASRMHAPLTVITDPKAPRQPLPAHDGADYLKTIPGFSVIRKGGTDGDPVFRGMAASRVNVLVDGEQLLGGCGMRTVTVTRNVDAYTWGGEADATYALGEHWQLLGTLAYTRGGNRSDDLPLAQMPPLEVRTGLNYEDPRWSAGLLWRVVQEQDRYAVNQGNIVGQDLGRTAGFGVLSLNAAWRPTGDVLLSAGIDNLFDKAYAEHLSRGGAMVTGSGQTTRVNEPGRTLWLKVGASFD
jgi:outer membrane receptor for ferrienterochelin and colicin